MLVRLVAGPLCDRFGPRYTFAGCLLLGSVPTALAGTVNSAGGLIALRFFVGILGGSFVPCQVWCTGFFDKNVVGTANAFTGGWGNAGGGVTYFLMPAIFDSLVHRGLIPHVAWRVSFIVPFLIIVATATGMLLTCPDTPTGKWSERHLHVQENLASHGITGNIVNIPGEFTDKKTSNDGTESPSIEESGTKKLEYEATGKRSGPTTDHEAQMGSQDMLDTARGEVVVKPTFKDSAHVIFSLQTLTLGACYFCSFGAELAINSILGAYYVKNFPELGQTQSGKWAAMFGFLNIVTRPLGGVIADVLYHYTHSLWVKKFWIHFVGLATGIFCLAIGLLDSHDHSTMFGLVGAMAVFLEAGNGANFALVPHVHPQANGMFLPLIPLTSSTPLPLLLPLPPSHPSFKSMD